MPQTKRDIDDGRSTVNTEVIIDPVLEYVPVLKKRYRNLHTAWLSISLARDDE